VAGRHRRLVPPDRAPRPGRRHRGHRPHGESAGPGARTRPLVPLPVPQRPRHQPQRPAAHGAAPGVPAPPPAFRLQLVPADQRQLLRRPPGHGRRGHRLLGALRRLRVRPRFRHADAGRLPGRVPAVQGQPAAAGAARPLPGGGHVGRRRVRQRHRPHHGAGPVRRGQAGLVRAPAGAAAPRRSRPDLPRDHVGEPGVVPAARRPPVPRPLAGRHARGTAGPVHGRHQHRVGSPHLRRRPQLPRLAAEGLAEAAPPGARTPLAPHRQRLQLPRPPPGRLRHPPTPGPTRPRASTSTAGRTWRATPGTPTGPSGAS
jgi:hypothetical protein